MNLLWIYYFLQQNKKADEIWSKYIKDVPILVWLDVMDYPQFKSGLDANVKLAELVKQSSIKRSIKFSTYSKLIKQCIKSSEFHYLENCKHRFSIRDVFEITAPTFLYLLFAISLFSDDPDRYTYGLKCLQSATLEFGMEDFNVDLLADLQEGLENTGIPWPWTTKLDKMNVCAFIKLSMCLLHQFL